jgi:phenylacetate-CoA ligase
MSRLFNILRARRAVKEAHFMSRADLLKLQESRWRAMARYALGVSPFYRRHLAGIDVERCQITDIPPMTKELMVENWDEIVPDKRLRRAELEKFLHDPKNWGTLLDGQHHVRHHRPGLCGSA